MERSRKTYNAGAVHMERCKPGRQGGIDSLELNNPIHSLCGCICDCHHKLQDIRDNDVEFSFLKETLVREVEMNAEKRRGKKMKREQFPSPPPNFTNEPVKLRS